MARKFWEKITNTEIQFYDEPQDLVTTSIDTQIEDLQELLGLPSSAKEIIVQSNPAIATEAEFDALFQGDLDRLSDQRDYFGAQAVTVVDNIDVIDHRWMSPADLSVGSGTIESVCGEEVGNEAINAIDGTTTTNWQHDINAVHVIVIDLGYPKRIDGIRIRNAAVPNGATQLSGVDVDVAITVANLDDPSNRVGTALEFTDPGDNDRNLTIHNGRYVRLTIASTGHAQNNITLREIELRTKPRTAGL